MSTSNNVVTSVSFPQKSVPWLGPDHSTVSVPWYTFLFNIWQRTGGGTANSISNIEAQIADVQTTANEALSEISEVTVLANTAIAQSSEALILGTLSFAADAPSQPDLNVVGLLGLQNQPSITQTTINITGSEVKPEPTLSDFLVFSLLSNNNLSGDNGD